MNRRWFLQLVGGAVGGVLLEQAVPLGRVWSFPKEIVVAQNVNQLLTVEMISKEVLEILKRKLVLTATFPPNYKPFRVDGRTEKDVNAIVKRWLAAEREIVVLTGPAPYRGVFARSTPQSE